LDECVYSLGLTPISLIPASKKARSMLDERAFCFMYRQQKTRKQQAAYGF